MVCPVCATYIPCIRCSHYMCPVCGEDLAELCETRRVVVPQATCSREVPYAVAV